MLDDTDKKIIEALSGNGRMTMKELGSTVHLTSQAASNRVAKLEEEGIIEGYGAKLNDGKLGYPIHAFIHIYTNSRDHTAFLRFAKEQKAVRNNYKISGDSCYLMECRFASNEELDRFLTELNVRANYKLNLVINRT